MTIERCFGKFKGQWRLFTSTLPRYYPDDLGLFVQAAMVCHNVTIDVDHAEDPTLATQEFPEDPHLSRIIEDPIKNDVRTAADATSGDASALEKTSAKIAKRMRDAIRDYLEMHLAV